MKNFIISVVKSLKNDMFSLTFIVLFIMSMVVSSMLIMVYCEFTGQYLGSRTTEVVSCVFIIGLIVDFFLTLWICWEDIKNIEE